MEDVVGGMWEEVVGMCEVGVRENLLWVGGDWMKGIEMGSGLKEEGWKLETTSLQSLKSLSPTISSPFPHIPSNQFKSPPPSTTTPRTSKSNISSTTPPSNTSPTTYTLPNANTHTNARST
uniref:hypothetical protein n=1 Tax=Bacillus subtilis TaxID=1423 RepID=UPI001BDB9672